MTTNTPLRVASMRTPSTPSDQPAITTRGTSMKSPARARVAAWNVIADLELPVGTKVVVEDGWVIIRPRGGQPARTPYGPEDTLDSLYGALKDVALAVTQDTH